MLKSYYVMLVIVTVSHRLHRKEPILRNTNNNLKVKKCTYCRTVEISIYRMPGKIKFRIKITEIIMITKTPSTIDDDIRSNVTLPTHIQNMSWSSSIHTNEWDTYTLLSSNSQYVALFVIGKKVFKQPVLSNNWDFHLKFASTTLCPQRTIIQLDSFTVTFSQDFPITNSDVITTSKTSPACSQCSLDRGKRKANRD